MNKQKVSNQLYLNLQKILRCMDLGRGLKGKKPTLTGTQMRVLSFFNESDVVYISEISRILGMSIQSVNNVIARLEGMGLVERSRNKNDKRVSDIRLTPKGKKGLSSFRGEQVETLNCIINQLKPSERKALNETIESAAAILEKAAGRSEEGRKNSISGQKQKQV